LVKKKREIPLLMMKRKKKWDQSRIKEGREREVACIDTSKTSTRKGNSAFSLKRQKPVLKSSNEKSLRILSINPEENRGGDGASRGGGDQREDPLPHEQDSKKKKEWGR